MKCSASFLFLWSHSIGDGVGRSVISGRGHHEQAANFTPHVGKVGELVLPTTCFIFIYLESCEDKVIYFRKPIQLFKVIFIELIKVFFQIIFTVFIKIPQLSSSDC
jgi:hypothetical protein